MSIWWKRARCATPSCCARWTRSASCYTRRDPRAFLWDALSAAEAIQSFVQDQDAERYAADELLHSAVERKFEIIGEALGQLAKLDQGLAAQVPRLAQIVSFRNVLIHGYAVVNHTTVWNVVRDVLPELIATLRRLLEESGGV